MDDAKEFTEAQLAGLAKHFRVAAKRSKADVARELGVTKPSVFSAEERPEMSLRKLRIRMIEAYSDFVVTGPVFRLAKRASADSEAGAKPAAERKKHRGVT
jgi:DNA-binding XRE family transcriptional regulator